MTCIIENVSVQDNYGIILFDLTLQSDFLEQFKHIQIGITILLIILDILLNSTQLLEHLSKLP